MQLKKGISLQTSRFVGGGTSGAIHTCDARIQNSDRACADETETGHNSQVSGSEDDAERLRVESTSDDAAALKMPSAAASATAAAAFSSS